MPEWFDGFFCGLYTRVLANQFDDAQSLNEARMVKRLLKLRKGASVLDIPCGLGRLTIPLARVGLTMTGVDLIEPYIRRARRRARAEGLDVTFLQGDMREIDFCGSFDAVFNWFSSFGYFSDIENLNVGRRLYQALKPGGRLLIDGMNRSWLLSHIVPRRERTIGGVQVETRNRYCERTHRLHSTWTLRRGSTCECRRLSVRVYNGAEIRDLLRNAGFREIELFGNPPIGRFTRHSPRFLAVAKRPSHEFGGT